MDGIANQSQQDLTQPPGVASGEAGVHRVPIVAAAAECLGDLARIVPSPHGWRVDLVPWPAPGNRPLASGTGVGGGTVRGAFDMLREGGLLFAENHAVRRRYLTGWYGDPATASADAEPERLDRVLTHEANYHPDGGQIFWPRDGQPFVALLAPPGDDVRPDSFTAFWCDGRTGLHVNANVWHQPMFPAGDRMTFDGEQGAVHACVGVDFVAEFGVYLEVPLRPA